MVRAELRYAQQPYCNACEQLFTVHSPLAAERYGVIPLPFMPFSNTGGEALSNNGVVAGGIANSDGSVSLVQWCKGVLTELGVPPGLPTRDFNRPRVFGINAAGAIVGTVHTSAGDLPSRWFICDRGRFTVLPLARPTDLGGAAIGINNRGQVVGYDHTSRNRLSGWLWSDGAYSSLPVSGSSTAALGINSRGTIIGNRTLGFAQRLLTGRIKCSGQRGYVLSHGTTRHLHGFVYAINDLDEAAGGCTADGKAMATVFRDGLATVILNLPSSAVGINSCGNVVGSYQPAGHERRHLFIWNADSGAFDLTPGGYVSAEAAAVNDRGEVLGFGETVSGQSQYFLLAPDPAGALTPKALITALPAGAQRLPVRSARSALRRAGGACARANA
jgi:probable HAF family extracellular repeat protein